MKEQGDDGAALTSLRTLDRCDLSTLLTAKYSMLFFFRPLYTVFRTTAPKKKKHKKQIRNLTHLHPIRADPRRGEHREDEERKAERGVTECLPRPMAS